MSDGDTRRTILTQILRNGPISATSISGTLGLSAAGVRRHLDNLVAEGLVEVAEMPRKSPTAATGQLPQGRGRGRPARVFRITDAGREQFGHDYDSLALLALRALREAGGKAAVERFADERMKDVFSGVDPTDNAPIDLKAHRIAGALTARGYAATVTEAGGGVQICRHHCPIQDVAHEFPELCAAEHRVVAGLLGRHIQPLATIADGNGVCTTHIPLTTIHPSPTKES